MNNSSVRRKKRVVLMIEDDDIIRGIYGHALREAGLLVEEAVTVGDALDLAPALRPDIIVLDRHLPDGDGWDFARKVKRGKTLASVPIIAFTSNRRGRADVEDALVAGCDVFLEKPCAPESLVRRVQGMLDLPLLRNEMKRKIV